MTMVKVGWLKGCYKDAGRIGTVWTPAKPVCHCHGRRRGPERERGGVPSGGEGCTAVGEVEDPTHFQWSDRKHIGSYQGHENSDTFRDLLP